MIYEYYRNNLKYYTKNINTIWNYLDQINRRFFSRECNKKDDDKCCQQRVFFVIFFLCGNRVVRMWIWVTVPKDFKKHNVWAVSQILGETASSAYSCPLFGVCATSFIPSFFSITRSWVVLSCVASGVRHIALFSTIFHSK